MLSILIPTYNYDVCDLVFNVHKQCLKENIAFEIICLDDNSEITYKEANKKIEALSNCSYNVSNKNKGRVATREHLAEIAKYKWLLFLDADVLPKNTNFIFEYLNYIDQDYKAVFGGFYYDKDSTKKHLLRWRYGKRNEEVSAKRRNKTPYKLVISANLLIKQETYLYLSKQLKKTNTYGGDLIFSALLKAKQVSVLHVDNEVKHLGLDDNKLFVKKQKDATKLLYNSFVNKQITINDNRLLKVHSKIKKYNLNRFFSLFHQSFNGIVEKQLLSNNPSIFLLQLLKLSYFSYLSNND